MSDFEVVYLPGVRKGANPQILYHARKKENSIYSLCSSLSHSLKTDWTPAPEGQEVTCARCLKVIASIEEAIRDRKQKLQCAV